MYVNIQRSVHILNWETEYIFRLWMIMFQPLFFMLIKADCITDLSFPSLMVLPDWLAVKVLIKNFLNIKTIFAAGFFFSVATQRICSNHVALVPLELALKLPLCWQQLKLHAPKHTLKKCLFILSRCQLLPFFVSFGEDTGHDVGGKCNQIISILPSLDYSTTVFLSSVG